MAGYLQREYLFGSYPQTQETDVSLCEKLSACAGDPEAWKPLNPVCRFRDVIWEGGRLRGVFSGSETLWFRYRPLRWRAVGREGSRLFLRSALILDAQPFNHAVMRCTDADGTKYYFRCTAPDVRGEIKGWLNDGDTDSRHPVSERNGLPRANCFSGSDLDHWLNGAFLRTAIAGAGVLCAAADGAETRCRAEEVFIEGPQTRRFPGFDADASCFCTPYAAAAGCERPFFWIADGKSMTEEKRRMIPGGAGVTHGLAMTGRPWEIAGVRPIMQVILLPGAPHSSTL